jgi:nucleotide-binding universal stress UspA family protein
MADHKIMVALRDLASVESLIDLACQVANGMAADLIVLHVVEVPMVTPLDAEEEEIDRAGNEILDRARKAAVKHNLKITPRLVHARQAGEAIVGEVKDQQVGLLIMGTTIQYVANHARCRVIVQIPPLRP